MTQKYLKQIGQDILAEFGAGSCNIKFKNTRRGSSTYNKNISIPKWSLRHGRAYSIYYIVHEVTHQLDFNRGHGWGHGKPFKELESQLLARYGIVPIYAKAYAKRLENTEGKILWDGLDGKIRK